MSIAIETDAISLLATLLTGAEQAKLWPVRVDPDSGCLLPSCGRIGGGYSAIRDKGRVILVHRLVYERSHGPIPEGLVVDHVRERGCIHRACINPGHLEAVTRAENTRRGYSTIITWEQAQQIRAELQAMADRYGIALGTLLNFAKTNYWRNR